MSVLNRDKRKSGEAAARDQIAKELALELDDGDDLFGPDVDFSNPRVDKYVQQKRKRYGNTVVRPWVVGMYVDKHTVRYFVVPNRTVETLTRLISDNVAHSSTIHTDE